MKNENKYGLSVAIGVVSAVIAIMSLAIALFVVDERKKQEDRELDEYLEAEIS